MANVQIPNLPAVVAISGPELVEAVQSGTSVKASMSQIATYIQGAINSGITLLDTTAPLTGGPITTTGTIGIASKGIDNSILANMQNSRVKANISGSLNSPSDVIIGDLLDYVIGSSEGMIARRNAVNWGGLALGSSGKVLTSNGTTAVWDTPAYTGTVTSVNASGGTTGLTFSGGPITSSGTLTLAGTLIPANGGTGISSYAVGDILYASATGTLSKLADVATGNALISGGVGVAPSYGKIGLTTHITGTLAIANGGTGATAKAAGFNALSPITSIGDMIIGTGTNTSSRLPIGTTGQVLTVSGGTAVWTTLATGGTVTSIDVSGGTTGLTFSGGPVTTSGTITMSGTLAIANGGTGQTTKTAAFNALSPMTTAGDLILGGASGTGTRLGIGTSGQVLTSNGTTATWSAPAYTGTVTSVDVSGGTTGLTFSGGPINTSNPSGTITMAGTLAVANGGTGATTASGARTALGLGTIATQDANNVSITGGSITILDTGLTLQDNVDTTKQVQFDLTNVTTGTTRTITLPNTTGTIAALNLAQTFSSSQTFSNATNSFGTSTATGTTSVATGATISGATKTVNIGTGGVAGSTTTITIGPTAGTGTVTFGSALTSVTIPTLSLTNALTVANGGTGATTAAAGFNNLSPITSTGDLIVGNGANSATRLGIGTTGQVLTVSGGTATWATPASGGSVTSVDVSGGTTGLTFSGGPVTTSGTITMAGTLGTANGGTGATTISGARTNLGLGTIATQDASNVSITGGSINGTTIGGSTPAGGTFSSFSLVDTDPGSSLAPNMILLRDSASPAIGDNLASIRFRGRNSAAATFDYGMIYGYINIATSGNENGGVTIQSSASGTAIDTLNVTYGKVGVRKIIPTYALDVTGDIGLSGALTENVFAITDVAGVDISPTNGGIQTWTLGANRTPAAPTNWAAGQSITLMITAGSNTITWTTMGVVWVGGSAPTLGTGTNKTIIVLWKVGTTIYGSLTGTSA